MTQLSRRTFLHASASTLASAGALATNPLGVCLAQSNAGCQSGSKPAFAHLKPAKAAGTADSHISLPPGFSYHVVQKSGLPMSDGFAVPQRPDGMICTILKDGSLALMRNHEIGVGEGTPSAHLTPNPNLRFDPRAGGGVSRVRVDARTGKALSSNWVLAGTSRNCAGGKSPFGYLSCEEDFSPGHGYVFVCDPEASTLQPPKCIPSYGRFNHEAATVDPKTNIAYLTEDRRDSAFYRFVPHKKSEPYAGKLQALKVSGRPHTDTGRAAQGTQYDVSWVDIPDANPDADTVRQQAAKLGAARFVRGEGIWLEGSDLYFTATEGGPLARGQVFHLSLTTHKLTVLAATENIRDLDMPDNLTVSPQGLIVVAEDGPGGNHLRVVSAQGEVFAFAENIVSMSEFAGPCFSPDGRFLFVNIQIDGLTLAISGPFDELATWSLSQSERASAGAPPAGIIGGGAGLSILALSALKKRRNRPG